MDFSVFDKTKIDEYTKKAKEQWGKTAEYQEYEEKSSKHSPEVQRQSWQDLMLLFVEFGKMLDKKPEDPDVQLKVRELQGYITEHFYKCTDEILCGLGKMYASGGEFTENIDKASRTGTSAFSKYIDMYLK